MPAISSYALNRYGVDHLVRSWLPTLSKGYTVTVAGSDVDTLPELSGITIVGEVASPETSTGASTSPWHPSPSAGA
jgi:hypothetical protein